MGSLLALALAAVMGPAVGNASPAPSSLTIGVEGAAPSSAAFSGGPITGSADESGSLAPVACQSPSCESIPLTVVAPDGYPANSIYLAITITFSPISGGQALGVDGLDIWLLNSQGTSVASATLGSSPATASAAKLDRGNYTIEISGENAAVQETYSGTAVASSGGPSSAPAVTQSPTPLSFGPATLVSPTLLGGEPQIQFERPVADPKPGSSLDPQRGYIDWPVSSRTQIGSLWRTLNGGVSFRQLVDLSCAPRQVPNCYTGGGGDTVTRVNNYDGTVNYGDQESLAQEAFASSVDHGDTFPLARQTPVTAPAVGVDRQWISTVDAPGIMGGPAHPFELEAVYSYHIPAAGEIVAGVGTDGLVRPGIPVIPLVTQSGPSRIDTQPGSPGSGWFYQGYRDGNGFEVAAVPLSQYQSPAAYHIGNVTHDNALSFPWIALDRQGNLYAVWVAQDGQVYYSYSQISDPQNNPSLGGTPATAWSPKLRVNAPQLGSAYFPEAVAGDAGRLAITYMATSDWTGASDNAPPDARWNTYVSLSTDALDANPVFQTGPVSHRIDHVGSICTSGTTCVTTGGDRSLLDMIDVTMNSDGRAIVVFADNNNSFPRDNVSLGSQQSPWIKVAQLADGPSLLANHKPYRERYPTDNVRSAAGDATWPNTAAGTNIPALDILGTGISTQGPDVIARLPLAAAGPNEFERALAAYNAVPTADQAATRLQYVLRWDFASDSYYLAAEVGSNGLLTCYGGKVDVSNAIYNSNVVVGIGYRPQPGYAVSCSVNHDTIVLRAPAAAFGLARGDTLDGFQAFSLAGPPDEILAGNPQTSQIYFLMREVDASPPMDAVLAR